MSSAVRTADLEKFSVAETAAIFLECSAPNRTAVSIGGGRNFLSCCDGSVRAETFIDGITADMRRESAAACRASAPTVNSDGASQRNHY